MHHVIRCFDSFDALPARYASLRATLTRSDLFGLPAWFALLMQHSFDGLDRLCLMSMEDGVDGPPLLLVPMRLTRRDPAAPGAQVLASVNHVENHAQPAFVLADSVDDPGALLAEFFAALRQRWPMADEPVPELLRLMPLAAGEPLGDRLYAALRRAGWVVQVFANSFNRYEDTAGLTHAQYFEQRSANLRYSVRRRRRALEKSGRMQIEVVRGDADLDRMLVEYLHVAYASWKDPRTMADPLTLDMIRLAAGQGGLRLGVLRVDGEPAAAQFWLVADGTAHCMRLAYTESAAPLAVGVVLTDHMLQVVLDDDHVRRVDFGFGDEAYKASWMRDERVYVGLLGFNRHTRRGAWQAVRHIGGQSAKRLALRVAVALGLRRVPDGDAPDAAAR